MTRQEEEQRRQWGSIIWEEPPPIPASSYQTITMRYAAGSLGIDEDGGIRISFRFVSDFGTLQTTDPQADHYVTAQTRQGVRLSLSYLRKANERPYQKTLFIHVHDGPLNEGDEIKITLGDRSGGSQGWRMQSFTEEPFPMRVEVDPFGAHSYVLLPGIPGFDICPGEPHCYQLHLPSLVAAGEEFTLRLKCEDIWGNPLRELDHRPNLSLRKEGEDGEWIPIATDIADSMAPSHQRGVLSYPIGGLDSPGVYRAVVTGGKLKTAPSNPMRVVAPEELPEHRPYWCDLHGQTGETVGTGTVEGYFDFGRHFGFLDGSCHQGNDFQIDQATWKRIVAAGNDAYEPGAFVTFNGIEWSGTTPMGGDHNVLFNEEHPPLYRSTGWLAADGSKMEEVAPLPKLYEVLKKHDAMTIPHIGGRPAALEETDKELERLVELHSAWGTFEWVYKRAFAKGFKVGFVCNSDGHKARPGASYPGASTFGTLGGLTAVLASGKTRDEFWQALKARRCYGTTGQRILVEARAEGRPMGSDLQVSAPFRIEGRVQGTAPLLGIELLRVDRVIDSVPLPAGGERGENWVLIRLGGSRVYGRGRQVNWRGTLQVEGNVLEEARLHGLFNPMQGIRRQDGQGLDFSFITTGNSLNLCLRLREAEKGKLVFRSGPVEFSQQIDGLTPQPRRMFEAPIDQFLEIFLCPIGVLPLGHPFDFLVEPPEEPETPFFIRVRQLDEAKAWTSPFYVSKA